MDTPITVRQELDKLEAAQYRQEPHDPINSPAHYKAGRIEAIDVIESFQLGYKLGNVIKYVLRHQYKGDPVKDLKKARWYLDRAIAEMEGGKHD